MIARARPGRRLVARARRPWLPAPLVLVGLAMGGCPEDPPPEPSGPRETLPIVDANEWERVSAADDEFPERPRDEECDPVLGLFPEPFGGAPGFQIDTGLCGSVTLGQPALVDLRPDEVIDLKVWHLDLVADAPAEAYLGLSIDGERLWEHTVPIPGPPDLVEALIEVPHEIPEGAPVQFHLDNHGDNTWTLFRLERQPATEPSS